MMILLSDTVSLLFVIVPMIVDILDDEMHESHIPMFGCRYGMELRR